LNTEKLKSEMWFAAHTREISDTGNNTEMSAKMRSIEDIPVKRMYDNSQYLENILLPKIEAARGKDSEDYKLFSDIQKNLLWAIMLASRFEQQLKKNGSIALQLAIKTELCNLLQSELLKYTTIEDLLFSSGMDNLALSIAKKVFENSKNLQK